MIKKLRFKFILIAMIASCVILVAILGGINITNIISEEKEGDAILTMLLANDGKFQNNNPPEAKDNESPIASVSLAIIDDNQGQPFFDNPEIPFSTRFFTVTFDKDSNATSYTEKIAAYSDAAAISLATMLKEKNKTKGYYDDYLYGSKSYDDGSVLYVFIDRQNERSKNRNFALYSLLGALGGLATFAILIIIGSYFALKPAIESEKKQRIFITDSSHSLKTPLAIIQADTEVIEAETGETKWTQSINSQIDKMNDLVTKMVYLSKMDEGSQKQNRTEYSLSNQLIECCENFNPVYLQKGISFHYEIKENLKIKADHQVIGELWNIFFENASKYTSANGWVKVIAIKKGKQAVITFSNSIDYEFVDNPDHLFDRFYRADASRNSKNGGTGLGLSIAKSILANEKGKVKAVVNSKESIVFEIRLPLFS